MNTCTGKVDFRFLILDFRLRVISPDGIQNPKSNIQNMGWVEQ